MARKKRIKVTIPGFKPDYPSLIQNDPTYSAFHTNQLAFSAKDKAARNEQIAAGLIQFGQLPSGLGASSGQIPGVDLGDFSLTPEQIAAITANSTGGTMGQLSRTHDTNVQSLQDQLAARGIYRSGGLTSGLANEQTGYENAQGDARTKLLAALRELQTLFAGQESDRATLDASALSDTEQRLQASGLYKPRRARTVKATYDPGTGLYKDAAGNLYDRNGKAVTDKNYRGAHGRGARDHGSYVGPPARLPGGNQP